jgi:hypothetical protein
MSYKEKQHWYITDRSTHHHTNKPMNSFKHTRHNTTPSTPTWERRPEQAPDTCAAVANVVPRRGATRYRHQRPPDLLHHGTINLKLQIHNRRSLGTIEVSAHTPTTAPGTPTDPGQTVWGPCLTHRLTLCQGIK